MLDGEPELICEPTLLFGTHRQLVRGLERQERIWGCAHRRAAPSDAGRAAVFVCAGVGNAGFWRCVISP
jgi:hypothetical protein